MEIQIFRRMRRLFRQVGDTRDQKTNGNRGLKPQIYPAKPAPCWLRY
jgi:hypothetical protein